MKFTTPTIELELFKTLDVIATSLEDVTTPDSTQPTANGDPYENDKW